MPKMKQIILKITFCLKVIQKVFSLKIENAGRKEKNKQTLKFQKPINSINSQFRFTEHS